ncbi:MAG: hypothetical protein KDD35_07645, partial [Bdellovibrionales bacterium]|nr:hypothetical protein [Bdellovibrionales bacterium]
LDLFLAKDGKLLAQAEVSELEQFDISSIKEHSAVLWSRIVSQIPYQGRVLSRQGLRVTVNLGKKDGINENSIVNAIQILKINRHPKFNFIVSSEKEIIGKIKLLKVDDTLSFGELILEKEKGAVGKGTKLAGLDPITYPVAGLGKLDFGRSPSGGPSHSQIAFGENPTSWVPQRPPTFGQVGASLGLGQFSGNMSLSSAGPISASNNLYPTVSLAGELWVTPDWTVRARLNQGIIPISNPRSGSNPKNLSQSLSETDIAIAYVFYSGYSVWDAKVEGTAGFAKYRLFVDNSDLRSFTTMDYSGFKFGAKGSFPVIEDLSWSVGGYVNFFLNPSMKESPVTSGSDNDASINQFGILAIHRLGERLKLESSLDFAVYSAQFTGEGNGSESATSASHRHVGLSASVYYLF